MIDNHIRVDTTIDQLVITLHVNMEDVGWITMNRIQAWELIRVLEEKLLSISTYHTFGGGGGG